MENKVLIVEDEESIRGFIKINLKRNNFKVIEASSGEEGVEKAKLENPDIILLDIMLPGIDGFKTCEIIRKHLDEVGIIMLTARTQDMDKIMGLEFGADDYVTKPFNPLELIARINALLRRINKSNSSKNESSEIISGVFKLNIQSRKVYKSNKELELTPKEYLIMKNFMENEDKAFTRDEILNLVWGYDYFGDNKIVDVNIRRLREKIEDNASEPKYIQTVWGIGYRWRKD